MQVYCSRLNFVLYDACWIQKYVTSYFLCSIMRRNSYIRYVRRNSYILFLSLVVRPSRIRHYALLHSAETTHSFIQQAPSLIFSSNPPNTDGPLVFWSDLFFRCFIKQEENSVWILSGGGCGGAPRYQEDGYSLGRLIKLGWPIG